MKSFEEGRKVEKLFEQGMIIEEIFNQTQIPTSTLDNWKKEYELKQHIKELIRQGRLDEASIEVEKFDTKYGQKYIAAGLKSRIAHEKGNDREAQYWSFKKRIAKNPNDKKAISHLRRMALEDGEVKRKKVKNNRQLVGQIRFAREKGIIKREKRLLEELFEREPDNVRVISSLIRIAKIEKDKVKEKQLNERLTELEPSNIIPLRELVRIAEEEGDLKGAKEWTTRLRQVKFEYKQSKIEKESRALFEPSQDKKELTPMEKARKVIRESENVLGELEVITEILENEPDETIRTLIQAEVAIKSGLQDRAEKLLKSYKSKNQNDKNVSRAMNKALQLVARKKKSIYDTVKWEEIYTSYIEAKQAEEVSTDDNGRE